VINLTLGSLSAATFITLTFETGSPGARVPPTRAGRNALAPHDLTPDNGALVPTLTGVGTVTTRLPSGKPWSGTTGLARRPVHAASTRSPGSEPVNRSDSSWTGMLCR
jgi:hypothetical protein